MSLLSKSVNSLFFALLIFCTHSALALPPSNLPQGVTPVSQQIYSLHMASFYICCGIGLIVFGWLIYVLIKFRQSKGAVADKNFHEHLGIELMWTIIPFVLLVIMAIPATTVLSKIHDTGDSQLDIKITGYQWKWRYEYLNNNINFFSNLATPIEQINNQAPKAAWYLLEVDHPLIVPVKEKIRLLITSNDVIHSWWVPSLGVKQDAVPGYINQNWMYIEKPGIYRGQCAELCGAYHAFMPIVVKAVSQEEFNQWTAQQAQQNQNAAAAPLKNLAKDDLMTEGKKSYETYCSACHQITGKGMPPAFPAIAGNKIATGPVEQHINIVLHGKPGTAMQAFGEQLDDETIAAIITYQRNAWGNDALVNANKQESIVQPADVKNARAKKQ